MPVARPEPPDTRIIAHIDLDCFYVQVEQRRHPELKGQPTAVVQYNPFRGGAIIAVGYEARHAGVTRIMRGDDARKICPDIKLVQVPVAHGKADLTIYRDAGTEVVEIFSRMGKCERASIDEVYLDITEAASKLLTQYPPDARDDSSEEVLKTNVIGLVKDMVGTNVREWLSSSFASRSDQLLACGAIIVAELRTAVVKETQFTTSAGIAHNKMLAKLASGMHKPAQQTLIPSSEVQRLLANLPTKKIKHLGGKLGRSLERDLGIKTMGDLLPYRESKLQDMYGFNTGTWLWRVARGMNGDEVEGRTLPKSHGCGKTFPGPTALKDIDSIRYWLTELSAELQERLVEDLQLHNRKARLLVVHAACHIIGKATNSMKPFPSKSYVLRYGKERIASDAVQLFKRSLSEFCLALPKLSPVKGEATWTSCTWAVTALSVGAKNIHELPAGVGTITRLFGSPATSNAKEKIMGTAVSSLSPSSVSDVSNQAGAMSKGSFGVDFQDEEVISLNEPDEKILNSPDASNLHVNATASLKVEEPNVDSPNEGDEDEESYNTESELPTSPNAYSVLSRRERLAWTQAPKSHSQHQSAQGTRSLGRLTDRPSPSRASRSQSCKSVKRNLMDILDSPPCGIKDLVCTPKFGGVSHYTPQPPSPLSAFELQDVASRSPRYPSLESQEKSVTITDLEGKAEVILCSPLESRAMEDLVVMSDTGQGLENIPTMIGMHHRTSDSSKLSHGNIIVASFANNRISELPASQPSSTRSREQVVPCKLAQDTTRQGMLGESPALVAEEDALELLRCRKASISMRPHQTSPKHSEMLASQDHSAVSPARATLVCSEPSDSLKTPTSHANDSPVPNAQSTGGEDGTSSVGRSGASPGPFKRSVFTRVDVLWEKWKLTTQKSTTSRRSPSSGSIAGSYETDGSSTSALAECPADALCDLQGQLDHKRPRKRKKASISDFFGRS